MFLLLRRRVYAAQLTSPHHLARKDLREAATNFMSSFYACAADPRR
jgi:hypothetical protein